MKKSVLIVDDEVEARNALARLLASHDYQVRSVGDSQEAMRELGNEPADVAIVDIDLPHVPGDSLAAFLRLRHPKTQIIFISGQYDMVNPERFGENTVYFRKPLDVEALLEALAAQNSSEGLGSRA